jgi:hypothetical protein
MAAVHSLCRLWKLPTPDTAVSVHRRRERPLPFLAHSTARSEREQRVLITVRPTAWTRPTITPRTITTTACAVATHTKLNPNATIIPLLKRRREEERSERMRGKDRSDEMMKTACEEVLMTDATMPVDSITSFRVIRDFSELSSGAQNPWGSIQRRNRRYRPRDSPHTPRRTYQYPADNYKYKLSPSQPTAPRGVIETIQHPHGIGPAKPVIRIPVAVPVVTAGHPKTPVHSNTTKSAHFAVNFECHCRRLIQVSSVSHLPIISHPTLTTLVSDFISHSFPSHILSLLGLSFWGSRRGRRYEEGGHLG